MTIDIENGLLGVCALLLIEDGDGPADSTTCTPNLTAPTPLVNSGFTIDTGKSPNQVIYIVSGPDLIITWSGASNGNCDFASSYTVEEDGVMISSHGHITSQIETISLMPGFLTLYVVESDATTTVSTDSSSSDGKNYLITWTLEDATDSSNTVSV